MILVLLILVRKISSMSPVFHQDVWKLVKQQQHKINLGRFILKNSMKNHRWISSASKPLYDKSGLLISDQTDRCDCNRMKCPGCFLPCSNCQSPKCGLECRTCSSWIILQCIFISSLGNLRTYSYEYRLYGTNKEITQQWKFPSNIYFLFSLYVYLHLFIIISSKTWCFCVCVCVFVLSFTYWTYRLSCRTHIECTF